MEMLLAHAWDKQDAAGWWMSEKLDGVRAYWDGAKFVSRGGNVFNAPEWFAAGLPNTPLDGELWIGRGKFQETSGIVRQHNGGLRWKAIKFMIFDAPDHGGTFEERLAYIKTIKTDYACAVDHAQADSTEKMLLVLEEVQKIGGEGLMLRKPGSHYERRRSKTLLKVKTFKDDDAVVVGYSAGMGKHEGRVGALMCQWNGVAFSVGTGLSDRDRDAPPQIGSMIIFRYQELTNAGVPRFPSYVGIRAD